MNLVLDEVKETLRGKFYCVVVMNCAAVYFGVTKNRANKDNSDPDDPFILLDETRDLGRVIVRGPLLQGISPVEGSEFIANPFAEQAPVVL